MNQRIGRLTPRQREVYDLLVEGHETKTIAAKLGCSEITAVGHVRRVVQTLGCATRVEVIVAHWRELVQGLTAKDPGLRDLIQQAAGKVDIIPVLTVNTSGQ